MLLFEKAKSVFFFVFHFVLKYFGFVIILFFYLNIPPKHFLAQIQKLLSVHTFIEYNIYLLTFQNKLLFVYCLACYDVLHV